MSYKGSEKEKIYRKKYNKEYWAKNKEHLKEYNAEYRKVNKSKVLAGARTYNRKIKEIVLGYYGNICVCCGEQRKSMLAIDHLAGKGNKHRKDLKLSGTGFYQWLIKNDFPEGFQVLCWNCNASKYFNGGICEHNIGGNNDRRN